MSPETPTRETRRHSSKSVSFHRPQSPSDLTSISPLIQPRSHSDSQLTPQFGLLQVRKEGTNASDQSVYSKNSTKTSNALMRTSTLLRVSIDDTDELIETMEEVDSFEIPAVFLRQGMVLLKISHKSKKRIHLRVDPANFKIMYNVVSKSKTYEFLVDDIRSFCARKHANHYREEYGISKEFEKRWLTVVYYNHTKNKLKTLNLIADTSHDLKKLLYIIENFKRLKDEISRNFLVNLKDLDEASRSIVVGKAEAIDKNVKEILTFADVLKFCKRLNINLNPDRLQSLFVDVHTADREGIDFNQFKSFVRMLKKRPDFSSIWRELVNDKDSMKYDEFKSFMINIQKEPYDLEYYTKVFKKFSAEGTRSWTEESLDNFLKSKFCTKFKEEYLCLDYFCHPLNEYYILSSHNTYLIGRQVAGDSSVEGYIKALQRGCRCIEIDIWDNEDDPEGEPIVNHGLTFTNGISLSNALRAIKKYAFATTHFPLILSLEIHCSCDFQIRVIDALRHTFGESLVDEPIDFERHLPSPEALKNRILVKVKKTSAMENFGVDETGKFVSSSTTGTSFSENDSIASTRKSSIKLRRKSSKKVIDSLSALGVYVQGMKFRNFSLPESKTYNHCFSLSEKAINTMLKDESKLAAVDKHNRKFLMRIYPSRFRLKSTNFVPINYWTHGCQMVATNWQTYDLGQQLNEALFEMTQGMGYVLKPLALRRPLLKSTMRKVSVPPRLSTRFRLNIISAQNLPKPANSIAINPFIILEILGAPSVQWDKDSTIGATRLVAENGFNPVWNQEYSGKFDSDNELVFLRITVHSSASPALIEDSKEIALLVTNLFDMKQGFRYFPLKDFSGEELLYSTLFLKVEYTSE